MTKFTNTIAPKAFTQEVKDAWLDALRSGDYKRTTGHLEKKNNNNDIRHCCIGVLGDICENLNNGWNYSLTGINPYKLLRDSPNKSMVRKLWETNDSVRDVYGVPGYEMVIPIIESFSVVSE